MEEKNTLQGFRKGTKLTIEYKKILRMENYTGIVKEASDVAISFQDGKHIHINMIRGVIAPEAPMKPIVNVNFENWYKKVLSDYNNKGLPAEIGTIQRNHLHKLFDHIYNFIQNNK